MTGSTVTIKNGKLKVPNDPIIPFIEGDGTGRDIWKASVRVFDAAVEKAYKGKKKIVWKEVLAGQKAFDKTGNWLPDETRTTYRHQRTIDNANRRWYSLFERGFASNP
jgi:isocitrate dehydrogenase